MGVSGVGKSTVARLLAERLGVPWADADDLHPAANIAKMAAGIPLQDADRWPWLAAVGGWLRAGVATGTGGVVSCSALRRSYRDALRPHSPGVFFLHLTGARELLGERVGRRVGHFMPPALLASQFATLEPLGLDERGAVLDVTPPPALLVEEALTELSRRSTGR